MFYRSFINYKMFQKFQIFPIFKSLLFLDIKQNNWNEVWKVKNMFPSNDLYMFGKHLKCFERKFWNIFKIISLFQNFHLSISLKCFKHVFNHIPYLRKFQLSFLFQPFHNLTCLKSLKKFLSTICIEQVVMLELVTNDCTCFKMF
jgi:hypothetical protein